MPTSAAADSNHHRVPPALQRETLSAKVTHDVMDPPIAELSGSVISRVGRLSGVTFAICLSACVTQW